MSNEDNGIYLEIISFKKMFEETSPPPTFINDLDNTTKESRDELLKRLRTNYDGDELVIVPSCECGYLNKAVYRNRRCPECNTICVSATERPLQSDLWIRAPRGITHLINPSFWNIILKDFRKQGFNFLEYIASTSYVPTSHKSAGYIQTIKDLGIRRGYNYLCENFVEITDKLLTETTLIGNNRTIRKQIQSFIHDNIDKALTPYIPIPNRLVFITEKTATVTYTDMKAANGLDAVLTFFGIDDTPTTGMSQLVIENRVVKGITQLASYYNTQFKETLGKKEGWYRQHVYGARINYGGRAVISSGTGVGRYDCTTLSWGFAIGLMEVHITNALLKKGMSPKEIGKYINYCVTHYCKQMDDILKSLIRNCGLPGLPVLFLRNPTLHRGSIQLLFADKIDTDPRNVTNRFPIKVAAAPNADIDGDELNVAYVLDEVLLEKVVRLAPHNTVHDMQHPRRISGVTNMLKPVISMMWRWMERPPKNSDDDAA